MMRAIQSWGSIHQKGHVMSKRENEASKFRPSDRPLNDYEQEQKALRKNLERLKAERLAREVAKSKPAKMNWVCRDCGFDQREIRWSAWI